MKKLGLKKTGLLALAVAIGIGAWFLLFKRTKQLTMDWFGNGLRLPVEFKPGGTWSVDTNQSGKIDAGDWTNSPLTFGREFGDVPLIVEWQGVEAMAIFRPSTHILFIDTNHSGQFEPETEPQLGPFVSIDEFAAMIKSR